MKLSRLLVGLISLLWVAVFFLTLWVVINSTQDYLQRAMESHAQDTATSLGLSITHAAKIKDVGIIDTMTNAIFDRGYYREIVVKSTKGDVIVEKKVEQAVKGVPQWFIEGFTLSTPRMSAAVMDGWRQVAVVEVVSHAGHAYAELWRVSVRSAWVLLIVGILSLVVVLVVLRLALKPLDAMEQQAIDVTKRKFTVLEKLPWARELHRIANALNTMCLAVERMLKEATDLAERMRRKAYVDDTTGLMNRNDFSERLGHLIGAPTQFPAGALALVRIRGFAGYNQKNGRAEGDALLRTVAQALSRIAEGYPNSLVARLDGPEFALLVREIPETDLPGLGENIIKALAPIEEFPRTDTSVMPHAGLAYYRYHEGATFGKLMAAAASAVEIAQATGLPGWHVQEGAGERESAAAMAAQVDSLFRAGIPRDRIQVQYQPVAACHAAEAGWRYRSEAVVRIVAEDGSLIRAGLFIAAAKRLGVLDQLDRLVIEKVIERITASGPVRGGATAVNLSQDSLVNADFINWLDGELARRPEIAKNIIVEVAETSIIHSLEAARGAFDRLHKIGVQCSIDRFGQSTASVGYLRTLPVDYIKIDGSYTRGIVESSDKQFFVQALVGIAHGLGIHVITEYVESQADFDMMRGLAVDGVQGYHIGRPE
jgi:predicted signal transduction protein with EAL and GGDEF domain